LLLVEEAEVQQVTVVSMGEVLAGLEVFCIVLHIHNLQVQYQLQLEQEEQGEVTVLVLQVTILYLVL
jgi:hypothetical protein